MLSCGNKVSPASLLTSTDFRYVQLLPYIATCHVLAKITHSTGSSADPGGMNSVDSQHSQAFLFSGSEGSSSLELFSQPTNHTDSITGSSIATHSLTLSTTANSRASSQPTQVNHNQTVNTLPYPTRLEVTVVATDS